MLSKLRIQSFKSWRDTGEIHFAPLTGFWGPNSSGKSSIIQFLLLLKQTDEAMDSSQVLNLGSEQASYVDFGRFSENLFKTSDTPNLTFEFEIDWTPTRLEYLHLRRVPSATERVLNEKATPYTAANHNQRSLIQMMAQLRLVDESLILERLRFSFEDTVSIHTDLQWQGLSENDAGYGYRFDYQYQTDDGSVHSDSYDVTLSSMNLFSIMLWELKRAPWNRRTWSDLVNESQREASTVAIEKMQAIQRSLSILMNKISYLGPLREHPSRLYLWRGGRVGKIGIKGEQAIQALLSADITNGRNGSCSYQAMQQVASWLQQIGLIDRFEIRPIAEGRREHEVAVHQTSTSPPVLLTNVGFGVSQVLPVLALCALADEGSILILEQPEIHLHPAVQAGLADLLIDVIKNRNIQIILESHSEHLLTRLQRRIAEETLTPDNVALYFTHIEDGESKLEELQIDQYGNISNWPQDFFGDIMGDVVAMTEAAMHRQASQSKPAMRPANGTVDA